MMRKKIDFLKLINKWIFYFKVSSLFILLLVSGCKVATNSAKAVNQISSISPSIGEIDGGTQITILGNGFDVKSTVTIGGEECLILAITSAKITCTTPAKSSGTYNLLVKTSTKTLSLLQAFTYYAAPTILGIQPSRGAILGGTIVEITGTNIRQGATVTLSEVSCTGARVISSTSITCITPAHIVGTATVKITNTDLQFGSFASAYIYQAAPTVVSVSPTIGNATSTTSLLITGTGFVSGATVNLGGLTCSNPIVLSSTSMSCTTAVHAVGSVTLTVTNADSQTGSKAQAFTYQASPTITSVSPTSGYVTAITITGTGFASGATLSLGGSACASVVVVSSTSITCTTSAHAAGVVNLVVTNSDGQLATGTSLFTYNSAPTITSISKSAGALAGGTSIIVSGTGFYTGSIIDVGGASCAQTALTSTSITCTTTIKAAGTYTVNVTNLDTRTGLLAAAYTYQAAPTVTSISPSSGFATAGTAVTIAGTGFVSGATVTFGGTACTSIVIGSSSSITCATPTHIAGVIDIVVTNADLQSGTGTSLFTYRAAPTVIAISQSAGSLAGGLSVTVSGTGFYSGSVVGIGGSVCTQSALTSTLITCSTTANTAGTVAVTVTNLDGQSGSKASAFSYQNAPTVTSSSITYGPLAGGGNIVITGTGFVIGAVAKLGTTSCTVSLILSSTSLQCTVPAHAAGLVNIGVTNSDGQSGTLTGGYIYFYAPTITGIAASNGAEAGGTSVTITGTNFRAGATVSFDVSACTSVSVVSSTSITCSTPAHAAGVVTIKVTNTDTQYGTLSSAFTYDAFISWQVGATSPKPPNPDSFGTSATNITHTFTLKNVSTTLATTTITISKSGSGSVAWVFGTDTCTGTILASLAECTVQVTFLGQYLTSGVSYSGVLSATATTGGTSTNTISGSVP